MFTKISLKALKESSQLHGQQFVAISLQAMQNRGISDYAYNKFVDVWSEPEKQKIAERITRETIVAKKPSPRVSTLILPPFPKGKQRHPSVIHALGRTYGVACAVDDINAVCPEHFMMMRAAIAITRNPAPRILEAVYVLAGELSKLKPEILLGIVEVASNTKEIRSKDILG
ncbi:MAG TPA: hypothetical protein DDY37_01945, partial [Legionella sp.]|nr:hypothetical protein [Legionella sp.]